MTNASIGSGIHPRKLAASVRRRFRTTRARTYLTMRRWINGRPFWVDYPCISLPYSGDGDLQELYYHLEGKQWWEAESRAIRPYLKSGDVAVDIGANLGFMSGVISSLVGKDGQVFSFEPSPHTYSKLVEVVRKNKFSNVTPYNMGCGAQEGVMTLHSPASSGRATLRPSETVQKSELGQEKVRIVKLDEFLGPKIDRLNLVKIDTEGYEDEVLLGACDLLRRFKPVVYIELCAEYGASSKRAIEILRSLGYSFDREVDLSETANGDNFFALPPA